MSVGENADSNHRQLGEALAIFILDYRLETADCLEGEEHEPFSLLADTSTVFHRKPWRYQPVSFCVAGRATKSFMIYYCCATSESTAALE